MQIATPTRLSQLQNPVFMRSNNDFDLFLFIKSKFIKRYQINKINSLFFPCVNVDDNKTIINIVIVINEIIETV